MRISLVSGRLGATLLAGALVAACAQPASAQRGLRTGDAANGKQVAERLCSSCHAAGPSAANAVRNPDIMSFEAIAKQPDVTAEKLAGRIIIPHPAMPDTSLKISEIRDVIAYILSLRPDR